MKQSLGRVGHFDPAEYLADEDVAKDPKEEFNDDQPEVNNGSFKYQGQSQYEVGKIKEEWGMLIGIKKGCLYEGKVKVQD